jgi:hypothetical protein
LVKCEENGSNEGLGDVAMYAAEASLGHFLAPASGHWVYSRRWATTGLFGDYWIAGTAVPCILLLVSLLIPRQSRETARKLHVYLLRLTQTGLMPESLRQHTPSTKLNICDIPTISVSPLLVFAACVKWIVFHSSKSLKPGRHLGSIFNLSNIQI